MNLNQDTTQSPALRDLVDQLPAILWTTDRQFRLNSLRGRDPAGAPWPAHPVLGCPIAKLFGVRHPNRALLRAHRQARRGQSGQFEHRWGSNWYRGVVDALRDPAGNIVGCIGVAVNITPHRLHQQQVADDDERQRSRLSHELSEHLAQKLVSVSMHMELLQQRLTEVAPGSAPDLAQVTGWLREAVQQSCNLAQRCYPAELDRLGFSTAVENLARTHSLLYDIPCSFEADTEFATVDNRTGIQLYRLIESATLFLVSTGQSRTMALQLQAGPQAWTVTVTSNGGSENNSLPCAAELERRVLGQRTELLGGTLRIRPYPGGGLKVVCVVPRHDSR